MKKIRTNLLLLSVSIALSLAMAELILRVIYPTPGKNQIGSLEYRHDWVLNSDGYRDDEFAPRIETEKEKVILLGDSFTEGMGVSRPESFAALFSRAYSDRMEAFNLGKLGTGTLTHCQTLEAYLPKIRPGRVILFFYWNDVCDNLNDVAKAAVLTDENGVPIRVKIEDKRPFFGTLVFAKSFLRKTLLYQWAAAQYRILLAKWGIAKVDYEIEFDFFKTERTPAIERAWKLTESALLGIKALSQKADARLLIVYVPKREQIVGWDNIVRFHRADPRLVDRFSVNRQLQVFCRREGIELWDISERMDREPAKEKLYYRFDTHFTRFGNRYFANFLIAGLQEAKILEQARY